MRLHLFVSGRVQGVWYRGSMADRAASLGVAGWVRNLPDGRVEAVIEGPPEEVAKLVEWCRQGPPAARVEDVVVEEQEPEGLAGFRIRY
ncbi:MAG: acylphosphatase [Candidatus Dadabacteria bacterium]|nr:MAG: acylphosphatase [Candidatus Dadabacteria bacterium]